MKKNTKAQYLIIFFGIILGVGLSLWLLLENMKNKKEFYLFKDHTYFFASKSNINLLTVSDHGYTTLFSPKTESNEVYFFNGEYIKNATVDIFNTNNAVLGYKNTVGMYVQFKNSTQFNITLTLTNGTSYTFRVIPTNTVTYYTFLIIDECLSNKTLITNRTYKDVPGANTTQEESK